MLDAEHLRSISLKLSLATCTMSTVRPCPRVPRDMADASFLESFQVRLDGILSNLIELKAQCSAVGPDDL